MCDDSDSDSDAEEGAADRGSSDSHSDMIVDHDSDSDSDSTRTREFGGDVDRIAKRRKAVQAELVAILLRSDNDDIPRRKELLDELEKIEEMQQQVPVPLCGKLV